MEAWSPQCHWSSPVAKGVMVELEAPILSEAPGLGELSQVEGYLMTQAGRVQVIKKKKKTLPGNEAYDKRERERTRKGGDRI